MTEDEHEGEEAPAERKARIERMEGIERKQLWFNGILMGCGIAGVVFSLWQMSAIYDANRAAEKAAKEAMRSNDIATDTAIKQLRAWIGFEQSTFKWDSRTEIGTLSLPVKNYGQTPAYSVVASINFAYLKAPFDGEPAAQKGGEAAFFSESLMAPGFVDVQESRTAITANQKRLLDGGQLQLVITGAIEFRDVYKAYRIVVYQLRWGGNLGTRDLSIDYQTDESDLDPKSLQELLQGWQDGLAVKGSLPKVAAPKSPPK